MALIRPGPIKGNMVDPYIERIERRHGRQEPARYGVSVIAREVCFLQE